MGSKPSVGTKPTAPVMGNAYAAELPAELSLPRSLADAAAVLVESYIARDWFGEGRAMRFEGQGVIVTGGGSGIGRQTCLEVAAEGADASFRTGTTMMVDGAMTAGKRM